MNVLVCGAGGFIGSHLVKRLKAEGHWVRGVDLKYPEFAPTVADDFIIGSFRKSVAKGLSVGSRTVPIEVIVKDSQSNANRAADVAITTGALGGAA